MFTLRPAAQQDQPRIRALIRQVNINPMGLDWRRFWVAIDDGGRFLGCGQVKRHADGSQELASIATVPEARGQGVASAIIQHLIALHPGPLYLTCRQAMGGFYPRFGFCRVQGAELPPTFRFLVRLASILRKLGVTNEEMWVMRRH